MSLDNSSTSQLVEKKPCPRQPNSDTADASHLLVKPANFTSRRNAPQLTWAVLAVACLAALFPFIPAGANPLREELAVVQAKAQAGDAYYQGALALFHRHGERGLNVNAEEAEKWARLSAEKDGAFGLCALAGIELDKGNLERGRFLYDEAYLNSGLMDLARRNDPLALFCLSLIETDVPPRNFPKAVRHLEKAANQDLGAAQSLLGMLYFTGVGVKKDASLAIRWCSKAARLQSPMGMFYLGMAYSIGDGVPLNDDVSVRWLRAAADRKLSMAQFTLGVKYGRGEGVRRDLNAAVGWLELASLNGSSEAKLQLRKYRMLLERAQNAITNVEVDMDARPLVDIARDNTPGVGLDSNATPRPKPAPAIPLSPEELANPIASARKAMSIEDNNAKAAALLRAPAGEGNVEACRLLGNLHYKEKEFEQARGWFQKAATEGDVEAQRFLGMIYFLGQGVEQDYPKASHWFGKATEGGDAKAPRYLRIVDQFYKPTVAAPPG